MISGEARRARRIAELVRRLAKATSDTHTYIYGPWQRWEMRPRLVLEQQIAAIERELAALVEEMQVLLLEPEALTAAQPDTPVVAKIA